MKFVDIERVIDVAHSDSARVAFLERVLPKLRGPELRSAMIVLANLYVMQRKFRRAAELFELVGMHEDSVKTRSRI